MKMLAATILTFQIFSTVHQFQSSIPIPLSIHQEDVQFTNTKKALHILGRDQKYAKAVYHAAKANDIDPVLFVCLINSESEFKIKCKSKKGIKD